MKILVSDFDRTLYRDTDMKTTMKNVEAINNFKDKGNIFILATGRPLHDLNFLLEEYELKYDYLVCNDGGKIFDDKLNVLDSKTIPYIVAKEIVVRVDDNKATKNYKADIGTEFTRDFKGNVECIFAEYLDKDKAQQFINEISDLYPNVSGYLDSRFMYLQNKEVRKANGIKFLESLNNYDREDIYVIGDSVNDISMIKEYEGYAMSDCYPILKDYTSKYYDHVYDLVNDIEKEVI